MLPEGARNRFVEANGIRFHYVEQGEGPLVLLLHGFPEFWYSWRHQLPALAAAGFRAIAPDLRGYNLTDKPRRGYEIESLVADEVALARVLGDGTAHVAGHDWGGIIAWQLACRRPEAVRSLIILNAPHPSAFADYFRRDARQILRSSYVLFFQLPRLPEALLTRDGAAAIASALRRGASQPDAFTEDDLAAYRSAFLRPGVARCSLEYYRRGLRERSKVLPSSPIERPTLVLWGEDDRVLPVAMNDGLAGHWVKSLTFKTFSDCGHWTQQEQPRVVNSEMIAWLRVREAGLPVGV